MSRYRHLRRLELITQALVLLDPSLYPRFAWTGEYLLGGHPLEAVWHALRRRSTGETGEVLPLIDGVRGTPRP